jgi:hypothetical protein
LWHIRGTLGFEKKRLMMVAFGLCLADKNQNPALIFHYCTKVQIIAKYSNDPDCIRRGRVLPGRSIKK